MKKTLFIAVSVCALAATGGMSEKLEAKGSALPVSEVKVTAVDSGAGRFEPTEGRLSVSRHHGGAYVRVTTIERGMGQAVAFMNGAPLRQLKLVNVCDRGGGYWTACRNGQVVEGHLRVWDASGKGNGSFVVRATSDNWPRNTVSQTFSIW